MNQQVPPPAELWSTLVGSMGGTFVVVAFIACVTSAVLYLLRRNERVAHGAFIVGSLGFVGAFLCLAVLFLTHQFQFEYVFRHSARDHELQYLVAGVWSGQQGSFLLWGLMSALVGVFAARGAGKYRRWFTVPYAFFLACIAGILYYESPFALIPQSGSQVLVPLDGAGLTPSLLNYWVVIHPPTIFLGFGMLTVLFAYSLSALIERDLVSWIPRVRPWAVLSLAVLGVGLSMGGFWAYETLGWGGFWAWDPVENTSFVPWCAVVAFVHGIFVQQAKKKWFLTNAILAAVPFVLFCYGTFLTRSGFLGDTSVHSFATMDRSALWLLVGVGAGSIVAFVTVLVQRWGAMSALKVEQGEETPLSRGTLYGVGVWFLMSFAIATAIGMSVPFVTNFAKGAGQQVIEESVYHQVLVWFLPPLLLTMAVAPFASWKRQGATDLFAKVTNSLAVSIGLVGCLLLWLKSPGFHAPKEDATIPVKLFNAEIPTVSWVLFLTWLSMFVAVASLWRFLEHIKGSKTSAWAMMAHFGLGLALMGLIFSRGFEQEKLLAVHGKEPVEAFGYTLLEKGQTSKFSDRNNKIAIEANGPNESFTAKPGLYYVPGKDKPTPVSWPYIHREGLFDYYFAISEPVFDATGESKFFLREQSGDGRPNLRAYQGFTLQYDSFQIEGRMGVDDVAMTARFTVVDGNEVFEVEPGLVVSKGGERIPIEARIGSEYTLELTTVDPETHAVSVIIHYIKPAYPMKVYFKPLTLFVWLGIGIMGLGGLLAAAARRREARAISATNDGP